MRERPSGTRWSQDLLLVPMLLVGLAVVFFAVVVTPRLDRASQADLAGMGADPTTTTTEPTFLIPVPLPSSSSYRPSTGAATRATVGMNLRSTETTLAVQPAISRDRPFENLSVVSATIRPRLHPVPPPRSTTAVVPMTTPDRALPLSVGGRAVAPPAPSRSVQPRPHLTRSPPTGRQRPGHRGPTHRMDGSVPRTVRRTDGHH